jgi:hypothetical protein
MIPDRWIARPGKLGQKKRRPNSRRTAAEEERRKNAYKDALKKIPDQAAKQDPWGNMR